MKRLSFDELEAICAKAGCRFNDLFLVGEDVFVMTASEDFNVPQRWRPLLVDDALVLATLPEILRRLSAKEFTSMEELRHRAWYEATLCFEFDKLKYQLYDLLTEHSGEIPENDRLYLDLDGMGDAELNICCTDVSVVDEQLTSKIKAWLSASACELPWSVSVWKALPDLASEHAFSIRSDGAS